MRHINSFFGWFCGGSEAVIEPNRQVVEEEKVKEQVEEVKQEVCLLDEPEKVHSRGDEIQALGVINRLKFKNDIDLPSKYPDIINPVEILITAVRDGVIDRVLVEKYLKDKDLNIVGGYVMPNIVAGCEIFEQNIVEQTKRVDNTTKILEGNNETLKDLKKIVEQNSQKMEQNSKQLEMLLMMFKEEQQRNNVGIGK